MIKNYLIQDNKEYFRGQYKTPSAAVKWGRIDAKRYQEILEIIGKKDKPFSIVAKYTDLNGKTQTVVVYRKGD